MTDDKDNGEDDNVVPLRSIQSQVEDIISEAGGVIRPDILTWSVKLQGRDAESFTGILSVSSTHYAVIDEIGDVLFVCPPESVEYVRRVIP